MRVRDRWALFLRTGALGDFILSLPLLDEVCRRYGRAALITRRAYRDLLPSGCRPELWLDCDGSDAGRLCAPSGTLREPLRSCAAGADVFLFGRAGPSLRQALARHGVARVVALDPRPEAPPHAALHFLAGAGFPAPPELLDRPLWPPRARPASGLWLHPGSGSASKNAPPSCFVAQALAWRERHAGPILVSYGEADAHLVRPMTEALNAAGLAHEAVVALPLGELTSRMAAAALYVGNDSGVSHLAGALGIPTRIFFVSTDPRIWRPLGKCDVVPYSARTLGTSVCAVPDDASSSSR